LSLSIGLRPRKVQLPSDREAAVDAAVPSALAGGPTLRDGDGGALHPGSLRFLDRDLERRYQRQGGAESLAGFRIITATAAVAWLFATLVIPAGTPIGMELAMPVCSAMGLLNVAAFLSSDRAGTLDQQHTVASALTAVNGLVILLLSSAGGVLPGYAVSAIMLLFAFGFVSRTGFVFAAWRSAAVAAAFVVTVVLRNVLPAPISARLLDGERTIADEYSSVTVLFADIVGFTPIAARLRPVEVVDLLGGLFARFDELVAERGIEKIKTMGDSYMAAGGLPVALDEHAVRVVDLGLAMIDAAVHETHHTDGLRLRVGVHSGALVGGVIGHRKFAFDVWGDTVNIASRLESQGVPNRVHVSEATWRLVRDRFVAAPRGRIDLRGHGAMKTYAIVGPAQP
jgi:class 3 adenylate cyclase